VAIVMRMYVPGGTVEQYEQVNETLRITGDDTAPEGLILHVAGDSEDGFLIIDVWESEEALNRFFEQDGLGAALAQAGIENAKPDIHKLHNIIPQGGGSAANVIVEVEVDAGSDVYDDMLDQMPSHQGGDESHPVYAHIAAVTEDGKMYIADIWESAEAFAAFAESEIAPAAGDRLGEIQPKVTPVHNTIRGSSEAAA
jgi:heme-degrading monooxygenase HmoA